jgi:serpin B
MHRTGPYRYAEAEDLQMLDLPYAGDRLSMVVLLPRSAAAISRIEGRLSADTLTQWLGSLDRQWPREVDVYLPRFKMTWGTANLNRPLQALGMEAPFASGKADFSGIDGIKPPADQALFISAVLHKAFVDVNEEGTEAAAATAVGMVGAGMPRPPPVFRADHPFVFMIRDKVSGTILFLGRVMNPKA